MHTILTSCTPCSGSLPPERVSLCGKAMRSRHGTSWTSDARERFPQEWLPEFEDITILLTDFRLGGYRILGDIVWQIWRTRTPAGRKSSCSVKATQKPSHRHDESLCGQRPLPELPRYGDGQCRGSR